jgi:hypothetical protein
MKREWTCLLWLLATAAGAAERDAAPSYTNQDLDRMAPRRGEIGVLSTPAFKGGEAPAKGRPGDEHGEAYWRAEARKVRGGLLRLQARADTTRVRLLKAREAARESAFRSARSGAAGRSTSGATHAPAAEARVAALEAELRRIQREMRAREEDLEERARREGALPGWVR